MTDILDSIKARLYDFRTSPFLATFVFSWMFINYKFVLIFFSGNIKTLEKVIELEKVWENTNYLLPLYIALGYSLVFPILNIFFYAVKLGFNVVYNWVQQWIEDKTPLPLEKAKELKEKYQELFKEQEKTLDELEVYKNKYMQKSNEIEKHINEEVNKKTEWFESEKDALESQLDSMKTSLNTFREEAVNKEKNLQDLLKDRENTISKVDEEVKNKINVLEKAHKTTVQEKDNEIHELNKENKLLKKQFDGLKSEYWNLKKEYDEKIKIEEDVQNIPQEYLDLYNKDELKILEHIYRNDIIDFLTFDQWRKIIQKILNYPIIEVEKIFNKLKTNNKIFTYTRSANNQNLYKINDEGKKQLSEMFIRSIKK